VTERVLNDVIVEIVVEKVLRAFCASVVSNCGRVNVLNGLQRTWDFILRHKGRGILPNKLRLILTSITEDLDDTRSVPPDLLIQLQPLGSGLLGSTDKNETEHNAILDALSTALSLVYEGLELMAKCSMSGRYVRGSIGCAASPARATLPLVQVGMGGRNKSGHCMTSVALLLGVRIAKRETNQKEGHT
jgi:hypothetical protein